MRRYPRTSLFWLLGLCAIAVAAFPARLYFSSPHAAANHPATSPSRLLPQSGQERLDGYYNRSRIFLNSNQPYHEVHIPFKDRDGLLCLEGVWAGRPTEAILDTGSAYISWPTSLHLSGILTGISISDGWAGDITTNDEVVVLPSVQLGNLQLDNMPTTVFGRDQFSIPSAYSARSAGKVMSAKTKALLGAPAFYGLVLTVDYDAKQIIIRDQSYDVTSLAHRPKDCLLPMSLKNGFLPVVSGQVGGMPAQIGIDTGCSVMTINGPFVKKLPLQLQASASSVTSYILDQPTRVKCLAQVRGSIGGIAFMTDHTLAMDLPPFVDSLIGLQLLTKCRVTFDYTRNWILFEPYPISNSTPHHAT